MRVCLPLVVATLCLAACDDDAAAPVNPPTTGTTTIDASSTTSFAYFSLASGPVAPLTPQTSTAWDLAFRRSEVRVNGGISGAGAVAGYNLANNANATPAQVLAFTAQNQLPAYDAVTEASIPAGSAFAAESLAPNPLGWLSFGAAGPLANPLAAWKVRRTTGGGYAVVHTTHLALAGSSPSTALLDSVTVEWRYQPAGGTLGTAQQVIIAVGSGNTALNFATGVVSTPSGCGWDLQAVDDFTLTVNTACNVGTAPLNATESFTVLTHADDALQYAGFLSGLSGPIPYTSSLDDARGTLLYNLAGDNRLSPTFNTYLIRVGSAVYKLQVIGYYSATGTGGFPTIRYTKIR